MHADGVVCHHYCRQRIPEDNVAFAESRIAAGRRAASPPRICDLGAFN